MLLVGAGLLDRSFYKLQRVDLGFNPVDVATMHLSLPATRYAEPQKVIDGLFRVGISARGDWHLWRDVVRGDGADARDRHSHGTGRTGSQRVEFGDKRRNEARVRWSGDRDWWCVGVDRG